MKPLNILILGPSGSGKGTQAKLLAWRFNLEHLASGAMLRKIIKENTSFGRKINAVIHQQGKFVPYQWIIKLVREGIKKINKNKGIVFDGFARKLPEIKELEKLLAKIGREIDYVFVIKITNKEALKRLSARRCCSKCGHLFILGKTLKRSEKVCPRCGGEIYQRKDDTRLRILSRLREYKKETLSVIEYLKKKGKIVEIDGEQSIEKVHKDIIKNIRR